MNIEWVGYLATVFILASFAFSDVKKLRVVNIIGGLLWMVYGHVVGSSSIFIGNLLMVLIHMYKLHIENNNDKEYSSTDSRRD